jgi:hypothetical protein
MRESGTRVLSPAGMTTPLPPALALAFLRELSVDVEAAVVLDAAGAVLAGDADLAEAVRRGDDGVLLARGASGLALAVLPGSQALLPLLEHDLATVAADLAAPVSDDR